MLRPLVLVTLVTYVANIHAFSHGSKPANESAFGLHDAAKARGKYFGTAIHNYHFRQDKTYAEYTNNTHEFGQIAAEFAMKWDQIQPRRGVFTFELGDEIARIAAANKQLLRCHANLWHIQLPDWVSQGGFDNATLVEIVREHIHKQVSHYKGLRYSWDVVNEGK